MLAQWESDIVEDIEVRQQGPTLEQHAHGLAQPVEFTVRQGRYILARHLDGAGAGLELAADEA